jgi:hypothetical protein
MKTVNYGRNRFYDTGPKMSTAASREYIDLDIIERHPEDSGEAADDQVSIL